MIGLYVDETLLYLNLGIDGFFTDHPDLGVRAVAAVNVVPEPASLALLTVGALVILALKRRRKAV